MVDLSLITISKLFSQQLQKLPLERKKEVKTYEKKL